MSIIKIIRISLYFLLICLITLVVNSAPPNVAENFYGTATINNQPAKIGTDVVVFSNEKICGRYTVQLEGKYGFLNCNSPSLNDVQFEVNGYKTSPIYNSKNNVDLAVFIPSYYIMENFELYFLIFCIIAIVYFIIRGLYERNMD